MLNNYKSSSFSSWRCVSKHLIWPFLLLSSGLFLICLSLSYCDLANNRHGIPVMSVLSKHTRRFTSGCICVTSSCGWSLLFMICCFSWSCCCPASHYSFISVLDIFCPSMPVCIEFHRTEFGLFLEIPSITEFFLILPLEYPQFFLFQKDWDGSQVKPHRALFGEPFPFDQNLVLRSLWVSFFQAETCRFMKISSRPCFLSLWEYCTVFLTLWVALYRADLNDPLKGGIYV